MDVDLVQGQNVDAYGEVAANWLCTIFAEPCDAFSGNVFNEASASTGRDLPGFATDGSGRRAHTFTDLLRYVHDVPGIKRIRFATSHPRCVEGSGDLLGAGRMCTCRLELRQCY